ncbi:MAG: hypothetical protein Q8K75_00175 [Chlamydiales bacterium]|nr:hypothetical protein [Chlamydiales bacterium]
MEKEIEIAAYAGYFHDGRLNDLIRENGDLILVIESAQIDPNEITQNVPLSNRSTLRGKLILEKLKRAHIEGDAACGLAKIGLYGNIIDLSIAQTSVELALAWKYCGDKRLEYFVNLLLEAENVYWKYDANILDPYRPCIESYTKCFVNGKIDALEHLVSDDDIIISMESVPIDDEENLSDYELTEKNTLAGLLTLNWVKEISVDGKIVSSLEISSHTGRIVEFNIGYHRIDLLVEWPNLSKQAIQIQAGSISWCNSPKKYQVP